MRQAALLLLALLLGAFAQPDEPPRLLDDFAEPARWSVNASDGVTGTARPFEGGLRLDYDFSRGSGYAFVRRALPVDWPADFDLRFRIRGQGPANALEVKLVDASGENVWWHRRADYVPPGEWQTIRVRRRQVDFAWGPTTDRVLRRTAAIEFVVAAGSGGGRGWIAVDDLELVPRTRAPDPPPPIRAEGTGARAVDGDRATAWHGAAGSALILDLGHRREFGGLVLRWTAPAAYAVALSADGRAWSAPRRVEAGDDGVDWLRMEESEARYIRIVPAAAAAALREVEVRPIAFGASANAFVAAVAAEAPRGAYPRGFLTEQNYWTLIATPDGGNSGLMDEDGAIEIGRGGFSIEPFVDGAGWAETVSSQRLQDGALPIPIVERRGDGWRLTTNAWADAQAPGWLVAQYRLRNEGAAPRTFDLKLAVRPFQVNPPQQFLNITGGVSPIRRLDGDADVLHVNGRLALIMDQDADRFTAAAFDGETPPSRSGRTIVDDPTGLASGAFHYRVTLAAGEEREFGWRALLSDMLPRAHRPPIAVEAAAAGWRAALGNVRVTGPAAARPFIDTLTTALAHILATREGPALRPGSRSYARSWIRDGAMMSTALLRMGLSAPADRYLRWYAPYQYENGKVPCCVDPRGADPVPEHDSHGQLIHLVAQLHRYAPDAARAAAMWPRVRAAADHIETLRQSARTAGFRDPARRHLYGLLPPSISHEGYSDRAAYSYWDDFWALAGLKDAAWLAGELGRGDEARLLQSRVDQFRADILASIAATRDAHGNAFIPGAADRGDFDATSTTIALSIAGEQAALPPAMLAATFERYWRESQGRIDGSRTWDAYTPYEWRNVGALVRLGQRDRALAIADFLMRDRRPAGWNQWAEVVGREPRKPRFIGDMPHGWVASDFVQAVLDLLAYERPRDEALVIAAGLPDGWLAGDGIGVERLRTPYGALSYRLRVQGGARLIDYALDGEPPPGGIILASPDGEHLLSGRQGSIRLPLSGEPTPQ